MACFSRVFLRSQKEAAATALGEAFLGKNLKVFKNGSESKAHDSAQVRETSGDRLGNDEFSGGSERGWETNPSDELGGSKNDAIGGGVYKEWGIADSINSDDASYNEPRKHVFLYEDVH